MAAIQKNKKLTPGLSPQHLLEELKSFQSPNYWINKYVQIPSTYSRGKIVPFNTFAYQDNVLADWINHQYTLCKKPRQMGITTLARAYALWYAKYVPGSEIKLVSIIEDLSIDMLDGVRIMYQYLPDWQKPALENPVGDRIGSAKSIRFENGSRIDAVAPTPTAARGTTPALVILDEAAYQMRIHEIWGSVQPATEVSGKVIVFSTTNGVANWFYEECSAAELQAKGEDAPDKERKRYKFKYIKLDPLDHPMRDQEWLERQKAQLSARLFKQEVLCEFLGSGVEFFNMESIRIDEQLTNSLLENGRYYFDSLDRASTSEWVNGWGEDEIDYDYGRLLIYEEPSNELIYVIGADVATGSGIDRSTFTVRELHSGRQVCVYKGRRSITSFGKLLFAVGSYYNGAIVGSERNGVGASIPQQMYDDGYGNLYIQPDLEMSLQANSDDLSNHFGFNTTNKTRPLMLDMLQETWRERSIPNRNPMSIKEAYRFVVGRDGKPIAAEKLPVTQGGAKEHRQDSYIGDDAIFADAISLLMRYEVLSARENYNW